MQVRISFPRRIFDLMMPRLCTVCHERLGITEDSICMACNLHLPRTAFCSSPYDNEMAQCFWGLMPIEKAAALFYYLPHSPSSGIMLKMKYEGRWDVAEDMGHIMARECGEAGFFDGIDVIVPIPITKKRKRERGYNQSYHLALGISEATGIPIADKAVERTVYNGSQTRLRGYERRENVENAFALRDAKKIRDKHVLIIDDVVTTGSTIMECGKELLKGGAKALSVLSLGYTKYLSSG